VITGLTRVGPATHRVPEWPEERRTQAGTPRPLFEARQPLRKLVVVADADLLASPDDPGMMRAVLLTGLLTHPYIKLLRYRDEGPTPLAGDGDPPKGWAYLLPPDGGEWRGLVYTHGSGQGAYTGVSGKVAAYARDDTGSGSYRDLPSGVAADQRERDALAADVATAVEADLYITERPYLFGARKIHIPCVTLCRIPDALAMAGLYLRSQGEFVLWRAADGTGGPTANEWLFYQIGAVALLPEQWRWSGGQAAAPQPVASEALADLNSALLLRVVQALRTRDSFHRAFNLPQQRDAVRTLLVELDTILVMLMGAVDASARFIHVLLGLSGQQRDAGWQKPGWRSRLTGQSQPLADLFGNGTPLADALSILSHLRNTVHGQAIQAAIRQRGLSRDAPITLPTAYESQILASMDNLGGRDAWGALQGLGGTVAVDPGQFVEQLFPAVVQLLNKVMAATPLARADIRRPRPDADHPWYGERNRLSVSWQLGF
jgi:hypothetical protein